MKILIISPSLNPQKNVSGISSVVSNILKFGKNQYSHFELGSTDQNITDNALTKILRLTITYFKYVFCLIRVKPDFIHMNVPINKIGVLREYVILRINKLFRKKSIIHLHGGEFLMKTPQNKLLKSMFETILRDGYRVLVLSDVEKKSLKILYSYEKAEVLYNGVDTDVPHKIVNKKKGDKINILFLGRIHESKGILELVEAFQMLYKEYPFKFRLCGAGSLTDYVINSLSLLMGEDFEYRGVVSGKEKQKIIFESDIFLLPSHFEGLPMSLLEVMATGVVPVVTDVGSIPDVVRDGHNGVIIEKHSPNDIYDKLKKLLMNLEKIKSLSFSARETILEKYDVRKVVEHLEDMYSQN